MNKFTKTLMSFLLPFTIFASGCSTDDSEIETDTASEVQDRSFAECPDLFGHWKGSVDSGDDVEIWVYQDTSNIKVAVMFFTDNVLSNIAYYNLYPDGSLKSESEGPLNEDKSEVKVFCEDGELWLLENRTLKIGDFEISLEMIGFFTRDGNTMYLTSVDDSLPSGNGSADKVL